MFRLPGIQNAIKKPPYFFRHSSSKAQISDIFMTKVPSKLLKTLFGHPQYSKFLGSIMHTQTFAYQNGTRIHNSQSYLAKGILTNSNLETDPTLGRLSQLEKEDILHATLAQLSQTEIYKIRYQCENPESLVTDLLENGFIEGRNNTSVKFSDSDCLELEFSPQLTYPKNPNAKLAYLDHSVFSVSTIKQNSKGKTSKQLWEYFCNSHFWGSLTKEFSESIEADGVGMFTKVKHHGSELHPVIYSVETEQYIVQYLITKNPSDLKKACTTLVNSLNNNDYVPNYLRKCINNDGSVNTTLLIENAIKNQVTQGNFAYSQRAFIQHLASGVDPKQGLGTITQAIESAGQSLAPSPPEDYYTLTKSILPVRACIPILYNIIYQKDFFSLFDSHPNGNKIREDVFAILLNPHEISTSHTQRIESIFNYYQLNTQEKNSFFKEFKSLQPYLNLVHESLTENKSATDISKILNTNYPNVFNKENISKLEDIISNLISEINTAKLYGNLIDYETKPTKKDTGTLRQRFIAPLNIQDGFPGLFLEFIHRCDQGKNKTVTNEEFNKGCAGFGQANFSNLMKSQQKGFNSQIQTSSQNSKTPFTTAFIKKFPKILNLSKTDQGPFMLTHLVKNQFKQTSDQIIHSLAQLEHPEESQLIFPERKNT